MKKLESKLQYRIDEAREQVILVFVNYAKAMTQLMFICVSKKITKKVIDES